MKQMPGMIYALMTRAEIMSTPAQIIKAKPAGFAVVQAYLGF